MATVAVVIVSLKPTIVVAIIVTVPQKPAVVAAMTTTVPLKSAIIVVAIMVNVGVKKIHL